MAQKKQETALTGLSDKEVLISREKYGNNLLTPPKRPSMWKLYLEKFRDPVIRILLVAAFFSLVIAIIENEYAETIGIFFAIFLATGIGFYFEYDANKKFDLLNAVGEETPVTVIRNGKVREIPRKEIVVGDIVVLNTGEEIPADGILLEAISLQVNESNLTGELMVNKTIHEELFDEEATYPSNEVMRGTTVVDGHGIMKVERVGDSTEIGKVARQATEQSEEETPLNIQLTKLAGFIGKIGFTIATLTFIVFTAKDLYSYLSVNEITDWHGWMAIARIVLKYFMMAVTLIVVAVPEGLPMSVTLSLALNMRRMLKTNNLVRKMHACETMGAITVICTDKTGTLTQNKMQVYETKFYDLDKQQLNGDEASKLIAEGIAVNSTASLDLSGTEPNVVGNPTEGALLLWLHKQGIDHVALKESANTLSEVPFSTERKYMATVVTSSVNGKKILYVKGAPEIVYGMCNSSSANVSKSEVDNQLQAYQKKAMRTLGFAYQILEDNDKYIESGKVVATGLNFLGIVAISDPIRTDVPDAVTECMKAGIKVKIVTGDTTGTAIEIGRQIGLWSNNDNEKHIITGPEFAKLSDSELDDIVLDLKIIARARPMDKQRLVESLQRKNQVVSVTGDGTNDAPALKAAHVGLSMGAGTSVAKEASDITIIDNSFSSIGRTVMWGRSLYQNIQRFLLFQLTVNVAACFIVLVGAFMGAESPLTVTQMLWVNLIMDTFGAMALASLPPSPEVMNDKPRERQAFIINKPMAFDTVGVGGFFFLLTLLFVYIFQHSDVTSLMDLLTLQLGEANSVTPYEQTLIFSIFVWTHFWYMFNTRSFETGKSLFKLKLSSGFKTIVGVIVIGQIIIVEVFYEFFNVEPMFHTLSWKLNVSGIIDWLIIVVLSSLVLWVRELWHLLSAKKN